MLCILNTFEQFRYVMNCFYLCIHHFTPRLFRCFLHRYGIDIRPVLILSFQFLAPDSLHSDHRYGEDNGKGGKAGSRTSTQKQGDTMGKDNGETQRGERKVEDNGEMMQNEQCHFYSW